ncbi:MAG: DUF3108 domain-containing protein [Steroidobacterales bacterium]
MGARRANIALAWLGTFGVAGSLACAASAGELEAFQASYSWSWKGATVALSTLKLEHGAGDTWIYSSNSEPRGLGHLYPMRPKLRSSLRVTDEGVQPLSFKAEGGGDSHNADVNFDWSAGRATGVYEGSLVDLPLKPGIQDDLSVQIAMMVELLHGRTPEHLSMIDKNSTRDYRYQREGAERLSTPLGQIDTIIYSSQHPGSPRVTRFWCAPSRGYLPMRVEQKRLDSVEWTMEIQSLQRG